MQKTPFTVISRHAVVKLVWPLHHGTEKGRRRPEDLPPETGDNYVPMRRIPIWVEITPGTLQLLAVPGVSGNSVRRKYREMLADATLGVLGLTDADLPKAVMEMFFSGGGMDKKEAENEEEKEKIEKKGKFPLLVRDRKTLLAALPIIALFGASWGNQMTGGAVKVGNMIPALKELEELTGVPSTMTYQRNITSFQMYSRRDPDRENTDENEKSRQAIYYLESLAAGTVMFHDFDITERTTPVERSALQLALDLWKENPFVGGKSSIGYGKFKPEEWYEPLDVPADLYLEWLEKNRDVIVEYISLWDKPEKIAQPMEGKGKKTVAIQKWPETLAKELDRLVQERREETKVSW